MIGPVVCVFVLSSGALIFGFGNVDARLGFRFTTTSDDQQWS